MYGRDSRRLTKYMNDNSEVVDKLDVLARFSGITWEEQAGKLLEEAVNTAWEEVAGEQSPFLKSWQIGCLCCREDAQMIVDRP